MDTANVLYRQVLADIRCALKGCALSGISRARTGEQQLVAKVRSSPWNVHPSEIDEVRQLENHGSLEGPTAGIANVVVNDEQIAQRMVDEVEANVRAELPGRPVVLKEGGEIRARVEYVSHASAHEIRGELPHRQLHVVALIVEIQEQVMVRFDIEAPAYRRPVTIPELPPFDRACAGDPAPGVAGAL